MIKAIRTLMMSLAFGGMLVTFAPAVSVFAADEIQDNLCKGANLDVSDSSCPDEGGTAVNKVNEIIKLVINLFSIIVGVISVIMIIIGGLKYITSGGESGNVTSAKNTILYAIIGLVVVALAQIIVRFVLAKVSGSE